MAALKESYRNALDQTIKELYDDRIKFDNFDVTRDDLISLFVKPEHREAVSISRELYPWSHGHYSTVRVQVPGGHKLTIGQTGTFNSPPVLFPVYDRKNYLHTLMCVQEDVAPALWEKFNDFVQSQLIIFNQYQLTFQVMNKLNEICASPSQMRFFWPAIEVLASHAAARDNKDTLVKAIMANSKAPVPRISPALRQACQDTGAVITAQQMMGKSSLPDLIMRPIWAKLSNEVVERGSLATDFYRSL